MATRSFYLPPAEDSRIMRGLTRLARERDLSLSELVMEVFKGYLQAKGAVKTGGRQWASAFCGVWRGVSKKLPCLIQKTRSRHRPVPFE